MKIPDKPKNNLPLHSIDNTMDVVAFEKKGALARGKEIGQRRDTRISQIDSEI